MDEVARYNIARWQALADADALFTRPRLDLTPETARERVDAEGRFGDLAGQRVLCLAGGGGQQSAAFALLGAAVTVCDLSEAQLARDRAVAAHYGLPITAVRGDMRDLSAFADAAFDLVYHPYALNFVPEARTVFAEVARVLRPGSTYYLHCANPYVYGMTGKDWNGEGYTLRGIYRDGDARTYSDEEWVYHRDTDTVPPPREYRHTLGTILNGLIAAGFALAHVSETESLYPDPDAEPGTWAHFTSVVPPWLVFWATKR